MTRMRILKKICLIWLDIELDKRRTSIKAIQASFKIGSLTGSSRLPEYVNLNFSAF